MEQRPDETLVEFARRCERNGHPEHSVSWEQTVGAAWLAQLASTFPEGTSPQSMVRGMAATRLTDQLMTDAACEEGMEDISETLHMIADDLDELARGEE